MRADLPPNIRKVLDVAAENNWELNPPGVTIAVRLNHATDKLADPVYISWVVGRTQKGKLSYRFDGCGTRGLVPLSGADLLVYLADPTVVYLTDEDIQERSNAHDERVRPKWDDSAEPEVNAMKQLGGTLLSVDRAFSSPPITGKPQESKSSPVSAKPLRVMLPNL
jgi:hypothetical protein